MKNLLSCTDSQWFQSALYFLLSIIRRIQLLWGSSPGSAMPGACQLKEDTKKIRQICILCFFIPIPDHKYLLSLHHLPPWDSLSLFLIHGIQTINSESTFIWEKSGLRRKGSASQFTLLLLLLLLFPKLKQLWNQKSLSTISWFQEAESVGAGSLVFTQSIFYPL